LEQKKFSHFIFIKTVYCVRTLTGVQKNITFVGKNKTVTKETSTKLFENKKVI